MPGSFIHKKADRPNALCVTAMRDLAPTCINFSLESDDIQAVSDVSKH